MNIDELINETWQDFNNLKSNPETAEILVPAAMPLLWFGDLAAYEKSELRVMTISKNPSYAEFGDTYRFEKLLTEPSEAYKTALNRYFAYNPSKWFNQLAKFLPIFDSGYLEDDTKNVALHADLFTPIATHPVWPGLTKEQRVYFDMKFGKLMEILQPDVLLTSLSAENLKILLKNAGENVVEIFNEEEPEKKAKYVRAYCVDGHLIVINGRNFQGTYFGGMTEEFVKSCLQKINEQFVKKIINL
jgi:hypothetical protein